MANYAYVENNQIVSLYDEIPNNWQNISNLNALSTDELTQVGWYEIVKIIPTVIENTRLNPNPVHSFYNGVAYETYMLENIDPTTILTIEQIEYQKLKELQLQWDIVRKQRDELMNNFQWRYSRYDRQIRLGETTTDSLANMDNYMQSLADITTQTDPYNITWPEYVQ